MRKISKRDFIKYCLLGTAGFAVDFSPLSGYANYFSNGGYKVSDKINEPLPQYFAKIINKKPSEIVFEHANVVSMVSDEVKEDYTVHIKNGIIYKIEKSADYVVSQSDSILKIDAKGEYLIPGLTDMEVYMFDDTDLLLFLANGITSIRIMFGDPNFFDVRNNVNAGNFLGPNMHIGCPTIGEPFSYYETPKQACSDISKYKKKGFDFISISKVTDPFFKEIIPAALNEGLEVSGYIPPQVRIQNVVKAGMHSTSHFYMMQPKKPANLKLFADSGIWHCPTLYAYETSKMKKDALLKSEEMVYMSPDLIDEWKQSPFDFMKSGSYSSKIKDYYDLGGKIILGTACRIQYVVSGFSIHKELQELVKNGISPYEAIKAGTLNASDCLHKLNERGTIEVDKVADLVLLKGNPLEDISNTKSINGVMSKGKWITSAEIDEMLRLIIEERKQ